MFERWGRNVYRLRWATLAVSALLLVVSVVLLVRGGDLTSGNIPSIESARALRVVEQALGKPGGSSFTIVFSHDTLAFDDEAYRAALTRALAPVRADPRVLQVTAPDALPELIAARLISKDRHQVLANVALKDEFRLATKEYPEIKAEVLPGALASTFTGHLAFMTDLDIVLKEDLLLAELVSMPLAILVLLAVFRTLVAATVPVGVGGLAVIGGVSAVMALSRVTEMAQYTVNVVTLIGLGVAIDYSLFIVSRYRDELARGLSIPDALARAVATAGRAVAFSGVAVGIGLAALLFFRGSYLSAMGLAGAIVVALAVLYALTFLPALLAVLGTRIHAGRLPLPRASAETSDGRWHRLATWVMRRPVRVLVPTLALVVVMGLPFARIRLAATDIRALPAHVEARRGYEMLRASFPEESATRVVVAVKFPTNGVLTSARVGGLYDLSRRIAKVPGVQKVESIVDLDPRIDKEQYETMFAFRAFLPAEVGYAIKESVGEDVAVLAALIDVPDSDEARAVVRKIREDRRVADGELLVTGQTANDVDSTEYFVSHTPAAILFVVVATYVVLFLLLGSVLLPLKAIVMNGLSISGSFGALVWIFQEGHLARLLAFEPRPIEPTLPVLLFCIVFGLSMDYEVLLLSRMQEEYLRTKDNTHAVAEGIERSGRLITSAAAIMVSVFAAFTLADVIVVKAMGLGMALAVTLDATVVRVLIVPATMRLFGRWNWWAPAPLARLYDRLGLGIPH